MQQADWCHSLFWAAIGELSRGVARSVGGSCISGTCGTASCQHSSTGGDGSQSMCRVGDVGCCKPALNPSRGFWIFRYSVGRALTLPTGLGNRGQAKSHAAAAMRRPRPICLSAAVPHRWTWRPQAITWACEASKLTVLACFSLKGMRLHSQLTVQSPARCHNDGSRRVTLRCETALTGEAAAL